MECIINSLNKCILFRDFSKEKIEYLLKNIDYKIINYSKDENIAFEGEKCTKIGIVIKGQVQVQKIYASGNTVTLTVLDSGHIFGEVIIFSDMNVYPSTITSYNNSQVMFISKQDIIKLCNLNSTILNNFMGLLSNKILMLNKKVTTMSYQTLRQKIASYILDEYSIQKSLTLTLPCSRKELAEQLGIQRPSLSRELTKMKEDSLIDFNKNTIKILNLEDLKYSLH
jgi:CRP-like cAMP-binding protein